MSKTQRIKLERLYDKLVNEIQTKPLKDLDKHLDRLVFLENKLKQAA